MERVPFATIPFLYLLLAFAACASPDVPIDSFPQYTKVTAPFTLNEDDGTRIPHGSTICHWSNGISEVYGPDSQLVLIARDSEAADVPHTIPLGSKGRPNPATHQYLVPGGSHISDGETIENDKVIEVYFNDGVILTIIDREEDYRNQ